MRQIRQDELVYMLYDSMRTWTVRERKAFTLASHQGGEITRRIAADTVVARLRICEFYAPGQQTPLAPKRLADLLREAIEGFPIGLRQAFLSNMRNVNDRARYDAAHLLHDAIAGFEVLVDSPEGPPIRFANFEGGSGVPATEDPSSGGSDGCGPYMRQGVDSAHG